MCGRLRFRWKPRCRPAQIVPFCEGFGHSKHRCWCSRYCISLSLSSPPFTNHTKDQHTHPTHTPSFLNETSPIKTPPRCIEPSDTSWPPTPRLLPQSSLKTALTRPLCVCLGRVFSAHPGSLHTLPPRNLLSREARFSLFQNVDDVGRRRRKRTGHRLLL